MTVDPAAVAVSRAEAALDVGRPQEALRLLAPAFASGDSPSRAWCIAALAHLNLGDAHRAFEAAGAATTANPEGEWGHRLIAVSLGRLGRWQEAMHAALRARDLAPHVWQTHLQVSRVARALDDHQTAWQAALEAVRLGPDSADTHLNVGACALKSGDRAQAERAFREALRIDPNNVGARNELARLDLSGKQLGAAATGFFEAARMDPREEAARYNLDLTLRLFLARIAYVVMIGGWIGLQVGRGVGSGELNPSGARVGALIALVAAPTLGYYRYRKSVVGMSPQVRRYLMDRLRSLRLGICIAPLVVALILLVAVLPAPASAAVGLLGAAFFCALVARLMLWAERRWHRRSGKKLRS
ncbi:MAG TPA: tetratricopeptide repeat protein [Mycobacteriales bacterium]|nr:tetratricopeptide repeat protein [Mycobacteriales bacterium]